MTIRSFNAIPKAVRAHRLLCHNDVWHTVDMLPGVNGFRVWSCDATEKPNGFVKCTCRWSGLPHYAPRTSERRSRSRAEMVAAGLMRPEAS